MANTQELMLRIRGDNTDAERKISQTSRSVEGFGVSTQRASSAMRNFGRDLLQVRDASDLVAAATRALGGVIAGSLAGTAVVVAGRVIVDAYNNVQKASKDAEKSVASLTKTTEQIGAGAGLAETSGAAQALRNEAEKVSEKLREIDSNKLQGFIAGITGARQRMTELVAETEKQAAALQKQGIVNTLIEMERSKNLSDADKAIRAIGEKYAPLIDAARKLGDQELLNRTILEAQGAQAEVLRKAKKAEADDAKKIAEARAKQDENTATENELNEIRRQRNLERERAELERQVKVNEERLRQEQTMSDIAEARLRFERSGAVFSGKGGATRFNVGQANREAMGAGLGLLESTRAGRQALEVARQQRARDVAKENFRDASRLTAAQRKTMASQIAASEITSVSQRAGGQEKLNNSIERLINLMETAPLVTSGAGSR